MEEKDIPSLEDMVFEGGDIKFKAPEVQDKKEEVTEPAAEEIKQEVSKEPKAEITNKDKESSLTELASQNTEATVENSEDDFETRFSERLSSEGYVRREELEKELSNKPSTENELLSELLNLDKSGTPIDKSFLKEYLTDYDKYKVDKLSDAVELVKRQIMESEGLDEIDARFEVEDKYADLFDEMVYRDSPEYQRSMRRLSIQAKKYITTQKEKQSKLKLPDPSKTKLNKEEVIQEFIKDAQSKQAEQIENVNKFLTNASDRVVRKLDKVEIDVDGEVYEYEPSQDVKKQVKDAVKNYTTFLDKNFIKDGKLDEDGLGKFFAEFFGKQEVNKLIRGRSKAEGKEELIEKDLKNATKSPSSIAANSVESDELLEVGRQLLGKNIF